MSWDLEFNVDPPAGAAPHFPGPRAAIPISWQFGVLVARSAAGQHFLPHVCPLVTRFSLASIEAGRGRISAWRFGTVRVTWVAELLLYNSSPSQVTISRPVRV